MIFYLDIFLTISIYFKIRKNRSLSFSVRVIFCWIFVSDIFSHCWISLCTKERWMVKKWIAMYKWALFRSSQKIFKKITTKTTSANWIEKKKLTQTSKSSLLSHPFNIINTAKFMRIPLVIVTIRSVLFHCFTFFNVCLNFFIEWTILKFSACSGIGFSITFFNLFLRYFRCEKFRIICLYFIFSSWPNIAQKEKETNARTHTRTLLTIPFLMTINPFLTIRIVMVILYAFGIAWPFEPVFLVVPNVCLHIYMCARMSIRF